MKSVKGRMSELKGYLPGKKCKQSSSQNIPFLFACFKKTFAIIFFTDTEDAF